MTQDSTERDRPSGATIHTALPMAVVAVGLTLLVYMVTVESEPGAIPLLLVVAGATWYFVARRRARSKGA
jgi:hypothetical protein